MSDLFYRFPPLQVLLVGINSSLIKGLPKDALTRAHTHTHTQLMVSFLPFQILSFVFINS